jgi:minor extracellular serine protease Vpr
VRARLSGTIALMLAATVVAAGAFAQSPQTRSLDRYRTRPQSGLPPGFVPAVARTETARYFVQVAAPSVADSVAGTQRPLTSGAQRRVVADARALQEDALQAARRLGGRVVYRYSRVASGFSAELSPRAAAALAARTDVVSVEPVPIIRPARESSVPFIGAPEVWDEFGARGRGMRIAVIDTGIDYTHADFGGPGTPGAYENNDPTLIEAGTFPTSKVIDGHDLVGEDYDISDRDPSNNTPVPDPDPLDLGGHGTHVSGICCGKGVDGKVGEGVAPKAKILAFKVFGGEGSSGDVIAAAIERAVDPNQDGNIKDRVDVISMSLGSDFGSLRSIDAIAAQNAVRLGTVVVAASGNAGNQPSAGFAFITGSPGTARGAISVAASIDEFKALTLTVNSPPSGPLPDDGITVHQDWSVPIAQDLTGDVVDARSVVPPADPTGTPIPADRQLCDTTPAGAPFAGKIALVFKGSTAQGDCDGTEKVFRAQEAGASAVILWSGFGGLPFSLSPGDFGDQITIRAVMVSTADGGALGALASPDAPGTYNTGGLNVTVDSELQAFPAFVDRIADFSSEGPARVSVDLKPDVTAPGVDIISAGAGTGDGPATMGGTSFSTPHVSGVAALLRQIHPKFGPNKIKALIMNHATRSLADNAGGAPLAATIMGAGRVRADESAQAVSVAWPGSLSFRLQHLTSTTSVTRSFRVKNFDDHRHTYTVSAGVRYADFDPALATVKVARPGRRFRDELSFTLAKRKKQKVRVRLTIDPSFISDPEQEFGWVGLHPNVDGVVSISQTGRRRGDDDELGVPWHVAPVAAANTSTNTTRLDLGSGSAPLSIEPGNAAGLPAADVFLLGGQDPLGGRTEEDITHFGARSFVGDTVDGQPEGLPTGTEPLLGLDYREFLTAVDEPTEPVEFGVRTAGVHNTTQTLEVDVLIDAGADGVFADPDLRADYIVVKFGGVVCVLDLSLPDPFDECTHIHFHNYSLFNTNVVDLVVDARAIGLTTEAPVISYAIEVCDLSGDAPVCDAAGGLDQSGTYSARLNVTDPTLVVDPQLCGGFFADPCSSAAPLTVRRGSVPAGQEPPLLVLFPTNAPPSTAAVVTTAP